MARKRKSTESGKPRERRSRGENPVLAGVAARMAEVIALIRAGRWGPPSGGDDPPEWPGPDDDGGLAPSGVRSEPPDRSGSGSAALEEPLDPDDP
jgi:hypothetical protein